MHFQATLLAVTLAVAGVMIMLFAYSPTTVTLQVVLGVVLLADGGYVSLGGAVSKDSFGSRRYFVVWGVVLVMIGVTLLASTVYSLTTLAPYVVGALLLFMGVVALWCEASR